MALSSMGPERMGPSTSNKCKEQGCHRTPSLALGTANIHYPGPGILARPSCVLCSGLTHVEEDTLRGQPGLWSHLRAQGDKPPPGSWVLVSCGLLAM